MNTTSLLPSKWGTRMSGRCCEDLYLGQLMSGREISEKLGVSYLTVLNRMRALNIPIRTRKDAQRSRFERRVRERR